MHTAVVDDVRETGSPELAVAMTVSGEAVMELVRRLGEGDGLGTGTAGMTAFDGAEAGPVPTVFVAWTVKV